MAASDTALNASLDALNTYLAYIAQNTGAPGTTGASEYASTTRQACSWNAAATHAKTNSSSLTLTNSGATPVTDLSSWSAVTAGTFGLGFHLGASITAASITVAPGALSISGAAA